MNNLGVDPEFFIRNKKTGKALSAHRLIGEEKINNQSYPNGPKAHGTSITAEVDRDGAALEVRNVLVTPCRDYLVPYLGQVMQMTHNRLVQQYQDKYEFNSGPVFSLSDLRGPPDIREFGCNPDMNAYTMEQQNPTLPKGERRRFTGGHIHISGPFTKRASLREQAAAAVIMDAIIGLPMVAILGNAFAKGEAERREWYGRAGSFRFDAGKAKLEYRTLSGRLLLHPTITTWALGVAKATRPSLLTGVEGSTFLDVVQALSAIVDLDEVARVINEHDVEAAEVLYKPIYHHFNDWIIERNKRNSYTNIDYMRKASGSFSLISFEPFIDLMIEANHNGVVFKDDMLFNWQLYKDKPILDHKYVGVHDAMLGKYDDLIFPQLPFVKHHIPDGLTAPMAFHYLGNGGQVKAVLKKVRGW